MKKCSNQIAMAVALSLVLLAGVFAAAHTPASDPVATDILPATNTAPVLSADATPSDDDGYPTMSPIEWKSAGLDESDEPHETIDSMLRNGELKPYLIPGFEAKGPFWDKYGYLLDDAANEAEEDVETYELTTAYRVLGTGEFLDVRKEMRETDEWYVVPKAIFLGYEYHYSDGEIADIMPHHDTTVTLWYSLYVNDVEEDVPPEADGNDTAEEDAAPVGIDTDSTEDVPRTYTVTVTYRDSDGNILAHPKTAEVKTDSRYSAVSPTMEILETIRSRTTALTLKNHAATVAYGNANTDVLWPSETLKVKKPGSRKL